MLRGDGVRREVLCLPTRDPSKTLPRAMITESSYGWCTQRRSDLHALQHKDLSHELLQVRLIARGGPQVPATSCSDQCYRRQLEGGARRCRAHRCELLLLHSGTLPAGPIASGLTNVVPSVYCKLHLHEHSGDSICEQGVVVGAA
ncbi:hypothetical protein MTO96_005100 [Rhipicephalus appendiculatus]